MATSLRMFLAPLLFVALPALAEEAAKPSLSIYTIDGQRSDLVVRTFKDGVAARLAHDHVIRAQDVAGELVFEPTRLHEARLKVVVQVATLVVDELKVRKRFGLEGAVSAGDLATIRENMLAKDQLWVDEHKTIEFASRRFRENPDRTYTVEGDFTLRGVTRPVRLSVVIDPLGEGLLRGVGKLRLKQSDFGYEPYSGLLGAVKNQDEVVLHITLVAAPKKGP